MVTLKTSSSSICLILVCVLMLTVQGQTNQAQDADASGISIQLANPQRTSFYRSGPDIQKGAIAAETSKLFIMKRGSYQSYGGMYLGSGPNAPYLMGGDIFWPYEGVGYSDPVVSGGVIYFSLNVGDAHLFALDARTGEGKWHSKREKGFYAAPTIAGDTMYIGADGGYFYAIDLKTVKEKWRHTRADNSTVETSAVVHDGLVYYSAQGYLYALNAETGELKWTYFTPVNHISMITVADGALYFVVAGYIICIDSKTGKLKWSLPIKDGLWTPLMIANGLIYFRTERGYIKTVDDKTGKLQPNPKNDPRAGTRLAIDEQNIYFGGWSRGSTYAIDAVTREEKWKFSPGVDCRAPVVGGESVYLTCQDGRLYALDAKTGKKKWSTSAKKWPLSYPVISNDAIYFISDDGKVYIVR
ncbi:MAG: PQQ-like beta-propeller repeat protein [Pyrinomonadaceae bacterium]|nr:PQQ-like beta-propeller repeat protein [Pyrinomonadaceae bacterium]